jgi:hypothetical protein
MAKRRFKKGPMEAIYQLYLSKAGTDPNTITGGGLSAAYRRGLLGIVPPMYNRNTLAYAAYAAGQGKHQDLVQMAKR